MTEIAIPLDKRHRDVLAHGILLWGGPAHGTDALAVAMGFESASDIWTQGLRIGARIRHGQPLTRIDWERALVATEIGFGCGSLGAPQAWPHVTGYGMHETFDLLLEIRGRVREALRVV